MPSAVHSKEIITAGGSWKFARNLINKHVCTREKETELWLWDILCGLSKKGKGKEKGKGKLFSEEIVFAVYLGGCFYSTMYSTVKRDSVFQPCGI